MVCGCQAVSEGRALHGFVEAGPIDFPPTYRTRKDCDLGDYDEVRHQAPFTLPPRGLVEVGGRVRATAVHFLGPSPWLSASLVPMSTPSAWSLSGWDVWSWVVAAVGPELGLRRDDDE